MQQVERGKDFGTECLHANGATLKGLQPVGLAPITEVQEPIGAILVPASILVFSTEPGVLPEVDPEGDPIAKEVAEILAAEQALVSPKMAISEETVNDQIGLETPRDMNTDPFWEESGPEVTHEKVRWTRIVSPRSNSKRARLDSQIF